ncbi:MAG: acyl carrier protein [Terriglobus sp.]
MTDIEQECIRRIAEAKAVSADSITPETTLESLQVDSLDRVSLSFDMEEQYGVQLSDSQLHQIVTVADVATAVEQALAKKQATEAGNAGTA